VQGCGDEGDRFYDSIESWVDESTPPNLAARYWFAVSNLGLLVGLKRRADAGLKAAELFKTLGDQHWLFRALRSAAQRFALAGDGVATEEALAEAGKLLDPSWPVWAAASLELTRASREFFGRQRPEEARKHLTAAIELCQRAEGDSYFAELSEQLLAFVDCSLGDWKSGLRRCREILSRPSVGMGISNKTVMLVTLGGALTALGHLDDAEAALRAGLERAKRATGSAYWAISSLAFLAARQGRLEDAARLIGHVDSTSTKERIAHSPVQRRNYDEALAIVAPVLGAKELDRLRAEGSALTEAEAVAIAFPPRT
jgi:tetratricopeptide (TPR) repeat protein